MAQRGLSTFPMPILWLSGTWMREAEIPYQMNHPTDSRALLRVHPIWGPEEWKQDGTPGSSFSFNGTTLISMGSVKELMNPDAITVEAWVYPTDLGGWKLICCNWGGAEVGAYHLGCENGVPKMHITTGNGTAFAGAAASLELEQWQHIAGTYDKDSGDIELYVNGEVAGTTGHGGELIDNDMDVIIGSKHSREFQWIGFIDEVRISDVVRAADELSVNQDKPFPVSPIDNLATTWGTVKIK
jgi:concanavalin A-like lectin/glucanase superfamily protein